MNQTNLTTVLFLRKLVLGKYYNQVLFLASLPLHYYCSNRCWKISLIWVIMKKGNRVYWDFVYDYGQFFSWLIWKKMWYCLRMSLKNIILCFVLGPTVAKFCILCNKFFLNRRPHSFPISAWFMKNYFMSNHSWLE